jgi:hypothetical protein
MTKSNGWKWGGKLLLALGVGATSLGAQELPKVSFKGQVRPRLENRSPGDGTWDSFTSMRVRAALAAEMEQGVKIFIQLQDVRLFGEEGDTKDDFRADNLDLHQGYLEFSDVPGVGGMLRAGRQEMPLGEQRLVGAVNWSQQGRSFDGVRYSVSEAALKVDFFAMKLTEATSPARDFDSDFFGAWGKVATGEVGTLDIFGLFTRDAREGGADEQTFGALWRGDAGPVALRFEGSVQGGTRGEEDVSAYMMAFSADADLPGGGTVTLWYDYLSGDEDLGDGEAGVFNTLFGTNHGLYGFADFFTNIPAHTGGLGLKDAAVKFSFLPWENTRLNVDLHNFQTAQEGSLSTQSLGNEIDVTLNHTLSPGLALVTGYSFFQAKDGMMELGRLDENAHWMYLMLNAFF